MELSNFPAVSIRPHLLFIHTKAKSVLKVWTSSNEHGITSLPVTSVNPHFEFFSTAIKPLQIAILYPLG